MTLAIARAIAETIWKGYPMGCIQSPEQIAAIILRHAGPEGLAEAGMLLARGMAASGLYRCLTPEEQAACDVLTAADAAKEKPC